MSEDKMGRILEAITEIKITLAAMETDLRHHIKRSDQHDEDIRNQDKTIMRLWMAVVALGGIGAGSSGPSIIKYLGSIL